MVVLDLPSWHGQSTSKLRRMGWKCRTQTVFVSATPGPWELKQTQKSIHIDQAN